LQTAKNGRKRKKKAAPLYSHHLAGFINRLDDLFDHRVEKIDLGKTELAFRQFLQIRRCILLQRGGVALLVVAVRELQSECLCRCELLLAPSSLVALAFGRGVTLQQPWPALRNVRRPDVELELPV